ncbi:hypothetical protein D3C80_1574180 [compost metagenome]
MRTSTMMRMTAALVTCTAIWTTSAGEKVSDKVSGPQKEDVQMHRDSLLEELSTDKAAYKPGENVQFHLKLKKPVSGGVFHIRYLHLDRIVKEERLTTKGNQLTWSWNPPRG